MGGSDATQNRPEGPPNPPFLNVFLTAAQIPPSGTSLIAHVTTKQPTGLNSGAETRLLALKLGAQHTHR